MGSSPFQLQQPFLFFFFFNSPVASLPLLKCSSLDHCNLYNSKIFKSFILTIFLCKNWKKFPEFHNTICLCSKLELLSKKKISRLILNHFAQNSSNNFKPQLMVHIFSTLMFNIFLYAIHQAYNFNTHTTHNPITHHI